MSLPDGYKKPSAAKRDEHNPRPKLQAGRPKVCHCCWKNSHEHMDTICAVCLVDLNALAKIEQDIAKEFPVTAKMTRPKIWARIWKRHEEQRKVIDRLKKQLHYERGVRDGS